MRRKEAAESLSAWHEAVELGCSASSCSLFLIMVQEASAAHNTAPLLLSKTNHLSLFLIVSLSDELHAIKIEDKVHRTSQFPRQIICQKAKASVLFLQKDKWTVPILGQETINKAEIMGDHSKILHASEIFPFTFVTLKKVEFYVRNRLRNRDIHVLVLSLP